MIENLRILTVLKQEWFFLANLVVLLISVLRYGRVRTAGPASSIFGFFRLYVVLTVAALNYLGLAEVKTEWVLVVLIEVYMALIIDTLFAYFKYRPSN
jgi:hypothetical protein